MSKRLEVADAMIAKGASEPFPFYVRAMELRTLARVDEAEQAFRTLLEKHTNYVPSYLMFAQFHAENGNITVATEVAEAGISVAQKASDSHAESELRAFLQSLVVNQ